MYKNKQCAFFNFLENHMAPNFSISFGEILAQNRLNENIFQAYREFEKLEYDSSITKALSKEYDIPQGTIRNWIPTRRGSIPKEIKIYQSINKPRLGLLSKKNIFNSNNPMFNQTIALAFILFYNGNQIKNSGRQFTPTFMLPFEEKKISTLVERLNFKSSKQIMKDKYGKRSKIIKVENPSFTYLMLNIIPEIKEDSHTKEFDIQTPQLYHKFPHIHDALAEYMDN